MKSIIVEIGESRDVQLKIQQTLINNGYSFPSGRKHVCYFVSSYIRIFPNKTFQTSEVKLHDKIVLSLDEFNVDNIDVYFESLKFNLI